MLVLRHPRQPDCYGYRCRSNGGNRKDAKIDIASGGALNIVNGGGSVTLHSGNGHQVLVSYTVHSDKIEVDQNASSDKQRVELRTHALPRSKAHCR